MEKKRLCWKNVQAILPISFSVTVDKTDQAANNKIGLKSSENVIQGGNVQFSLWRTYVIALSFKIGLFNAKCQPFKFKLWSSV